MSFSANVIDEPQLRQKKHVFSTRLQAGQTLADKMKELVKGDALILGIPAGGVPVGKVIAKELKRQFDILVVRKIQIPYETEAGFGALSPDGTVILNKALVRQLGLTPQEISECVEKTRREVARRVKLFRGDRPEPDIRNRFIVLVDDGLASGYTMLSAVEYAKKGGAKEVLIAVPTGSASAVRLVSEKADKVVCMNIRDEPYFAVADAYEEWYDLTDQEVLKFLID